MSEVHRRYEQETNADNSGTLKWLLEQYHQGEYFKKLAPRTQADYEDYRKKIIAYPTRSGKLFGDFDLKHITKKSAATYRKKYKGRGGKLAPVAANRHIQYLKAAWNLMMEDYDDLPANPFEGLRLNPETPRGRYVSAEEFAAFKATTNGYIPLFMEIAYLCRARWSEVASLKRSDLLPEGIRLIRSKGSEGEITAWSPRLRKVVTECKDFNAAAPTPLFGAYLIHDKHGSPIKRNAFQSAWGRAMRAWVAKGNERFTYHDLKAMGVTEQANNYGGHRSEKMRKVYVRKLQVVIPPE
jgi:integrase